MSQKKSVIHQISSILKTLSAKNSQIILMFHPILVTENLLPIIHKEKNTIEDWGWIPPSRLIVSDCSSDTYRISQSIDHFIGPLATAYDSYVRDTPNFLEKLSSINPSPDSLLITSPIYGRSIVLYRLLQHENSRYHNFWWVPLFFRFKILCLINMSFIIFM